MYYVYIIHSEKNEKLYRGSTEDLRERLKTHNRGDVQSTKTGIPWELIYYEAFANKSDARREELFLKSGKGRERIKYLLKGILKNNLPRCCQPKAGPPRAGKGRIVA